MAPTSRLLTLPPEIRDQIWAQVFHDLHIRPLDGAYKLMTNCAACKSTPRAARPTVTSPGMAIAPLLTCKQINSEARAFLYDNLTLHISSYSTLSTMHISSQQKAMLNNTVRRLSLHIHLDAESRFEWFAELFSLPTIFPRLDRLIIHSHMRPPKNYDCLIDAAYLLGPLIHLPPSVQPATQRAQLVSPESEAEQKPVPNDNRPESPQIQALNQSTSELRPKRSKDPTVDTGPLYASRDENPNFQLHLDYMANEVLFESPFIGAVETTDAVEEHEAVLRDCLVDSEFRAMAQERDLNGMSMALLAIAHEHEQVWLERLQHRRRRTSHVHNTHLGEVDGGGEWGVDPLAHDMSDSGGSSGSPLSHPNW